MKLFGLTGGIGMGKSTSGRLLSARGIPVTDTDDLARQLVEPGQPALEEIRQAFGPGIVESNGRLNRGELARKVFSDKAALQKLESILHPLIRELWRADVARWRENGQKFGVVTVPLLFETGAAPEFAAVICVACSAASQIQRLRERNWSSEQIKQRIDSQWPIDKKIAQSDFVIWTDTTLEIHAAQLGKIFA